MSQTQGGPLSTWEQGYADGHANADTKSDEAAYRTGWCQGWTEGMGGDFDEAEEQFAERRALYEDIAVADAPRVGDVGDDFLK